jgi:hypothetical protein
MTVAPGESPPRQLGNLEIAKRRGIALNIGVDLSFTQPSRQRVPDGNAGLVP